MPTYAYSLDQETYRGQEDSRETAVYVAIAEEDIEVGRTVWTAEITEPLAGEFFGGVDRLIEDMQERAYEDHDEFAQDWLANVTKAQEDELQDALTKAINDWAKKHDHHPMFFSVENSEPHVVTDKDVEEAMTAAGETA